jgi:hypothetical protein
MTWIKRLINNPLVLIGVIVGGIVWWGQPESPSAKLARSEHGDRCRSCRQAVAERQLLVARNQARAVP